MELTLYLLLYIFIFTIIFGGSVVLILKIIFPCLQVAYKKIKSNSFKKQISYVNTNTSFEFYIRKTMLESMLNKISLSNLKKSESHKILGNIKLNNLLENFLYIGEQEFEEETEDIKRNFGKFYYNIENLFIDDIISRPFISNVKEGLDIYKEINIYLFQTELKEFKKMLIAFYKLPKTSIEEETIIDKYQLDNYSYINKMKEFGYATI